MKLKASISLLLLTSLALMVVALYCGYGLAESDTGAYIEKGILNIIPNDRSPFYGWFIRYTSMWSSLWYSLFAQSLLLAYVLLKYVDRIQHSDVKSPNAGPAITDVGDSAPQQFRFKLFTVITIVSFTCVSWVVSYLMPDVFAGILLLGALLFLTEKTGKAMQLLIYVLIIFLSIIVHNSHFLILGPFAILLIVWSLVKKYTVVLKRSIVLLSLSALSWALMCTVNAANGYGFTYSRGSHVFMMGKFVETGLLKTYLDDNCATKNLKLCNYKDQIPMYSWDFLWDLQGPLYKTGGWDSSKTEYSAIINDVFTRPRYVNLFARSCATSTLRQLFDVQAPDHTTFQGKWSSPWQRIGTYFCDELNEYCNSKLYTDGLSATGNNYIYYLFFVLSAVWLLFHKQVFGKELLFIYAGIFLFLVLNAFVTATFSTVVPRFQNRVFWVLPATNAIIIAAYYWGKFQRTDDLQQ